MPPAPRQRPATQAWWSLVGDRPGRVEPREADPDPDATVAIAVPDLWERDDEPVGRVPRAARPGALPPARAVAGAVVAVAGVVLGIGTLLWATEAPSGDPAVRPAAADVAGQEPAVALPDEEQVPVTPPDLLVDVPPPAPAPAPAPPAPPAPAPVAAAPELVPVLVLNNSRISGLAERAADRFEDAGWPVRDTGSLRGRIRATTIYYPPGQEDVARQFAARFPEVQRVLPRLANLPGEGLTVVVTRDIT